MKNNLKEDLTAMSSCVYDAKIVEIKERHEDNANISLVIHGPDSSPRWTLVGWQAHHDRATLLDKVERMTVEIEKQRAKIEYLMREDNKHSVSDIDTITLSKNEEIEWLRVQIERMTCDRKNIVAEVEKLRWDTQLLHRSNETLAAENERLREMLLDIAEELRGEEPRIVFRIRKALGGTP